MNLHRQKKTYSEIAAVVKRCRYTVRTVIKNNYQIKYW